jgi:hypothetical protein
MDSDTLQPILDELTKMRTWKNSPTMAMCEWQADFSDRGSASMNPEIFWLATELDRPNYRGSHIAP